MSKALLVPDCRTMFCTAELYTADITLYKPSPRQSLQKLRTHRKHQNLKTRPTNKRKMKRRRKKKITGLSTSPKERPKIH